ncbi:MAG: hypothetical protein LKJ69_05775 [Lactobacillus sp.]|jgi:hypothetical protein|nr:hypothetical protein [Lactobacillus sp.]MCI2032895.1 hypothetical protein [Lactobacillus sp.]
MASINIMKWSLRALVALTVVLMLTHLATLGILLLAVDVHLGVFYAMTRNKCDRRQLKHIPITHRM